MDSTIIAAIIGGTSTIIAAFIAYYAAKHNFQKSKEPTMVEKNTEILKEQYEKVISVLYKEFYYYIENNNSNILNKQLYFDLEKIKNINDVFTENNLKLIPDEIINSYVKLRTETTHCNNKVKEYLRTKTNKNSEWQPIILYSNVLNRIDILKLKILQGDFLLTIKKFNNLYRKELGYSIEELKK